MSPTWAGPDLFLIEIRTKERITASDLYCHLYFTAILSLPGRPSMDILVRSWQDLAKILEKS